MNSTSGPTSGYAAIYTRISDDPTGERAGVTRQLADCQDLGERLGVTVVEHFDDNDISAFSGKIRPGYEKLLAGMKRGEFTMVICWHPDRLYRSLKDLERLIDIADASGAQIRTVNGGDFNLSDATGKMVARILGSVSRQESEHKAERQRRANQQRRVDGRWCAFGLAPFGYTRIVKTADNPCPPFGKSTPVGAYTIVPVEPAATMVRDAAAAVLTGASLRSVVADFNRRGITTTKGRPWRNVTLSYLLTNPVYVALVANPYATRPSTHRRRHHPQVIADGDWEPILDRETHDALVTLLSDPARNKNIKWRREHQGSGIYDCGACGAKLFANYNMSGDGPTRRHQLVYRCKGSRDTPGVPGPKCGLARSAAQLDILVTETVLKMMHEHDIRSRLADTPDVDLDELRTQRAAKTEKLKELVRMFNADQIDGDQLATGTADAKAKIRVIDQTLARFATSSAALKWLDEAEADGDPALELARRWDATSADTRGKIIDNLITVTVLPARRGFNQFDPDRIRIVNKV